MDNYKLFTIKQMIEELTKKLSRLVEASSEWTETYLRRENLKKDLDEK